MEKLIRLDKQTEKKGQAVSIALGVIGSLLLGVGIMGLAYPMYKKLTVKERAKVAEQIIALSDELL